MDEDKEVEVLVAVCLDLGCESFSTMEKKNIKKATNRTQTLGSLYHGKCSVFVIIGVLLFIIKF
jgi:hypothetical protein